MTKGQAKHVETSKGLKMTQSETRLRPKAAAPPKEAVEVRGDEALSPASFSGKERSEETV